MKNRWIESACHVWYSEMKGIVRDQGVLIFFVVVPLIYPLLYAWIYNNEVVRNTPVAVVDDSNTPLSRQFIRHCNAMPDVEILYNVANMEEAQSLMERQEVWGIYHIPADFATRLNRFEQATVSVYCDMSLMLIYKSIYETAMTVIQEMNAEIQTKLSGAYTKREEQLVSHPIKISPVSLFNSSGGYGNFILPGVLALIIQQTLVLGIGLSAGTARERNRFGEIAPVTRYYTNVSCIVAGKALCYIVVFSVLSCYLTMVVPRLFHLSTLAGAKELAGILVPYILSCIFFGMTVSCLIRYRENVFLLVVFSSVPLLFLAGISWPQSSMPIFWRGLSWLFPSTFGAQAFVRANVMGASLSEVKVECFAMWVQTIVYFVTASAIYYYQLRVLRHKLRLELIDLRKKRSAKKD